MKTNFLALVLGGLTLILAGCVSTLDGKHEGGMPLVKDTAEGQYERTVDQVMKAARDAIASNGELTVVNVVGNTLEGKVDKRRVWMKVEPLSIRVTKLSVQVRTSAGGTDMDLAGFLREQVAVRLASGNTIPVIPPVKGTNAPGK
jgi:hypothetical protein